MKKIILNVLVIVALIASSFVSANLVLNNRQPGANSNFSNTASAVPRSSNTCYTASTVECLPNVSATSRGPKDSIDKFDPNAKPLDKGSWKIESLVVTGLINGNTKSYKYFSHGRIYVVTVSSRFKQLCAIGGTSSCQEQDCDGDDLGLHKCNK